jgi:2-polyprenyl-3-methyl-5-hydroxy-6-metoxy-1,4-benzoquinol methylase
MLDQESYANNANASLTAPFYESWWPGFSKEPDGEERMRMSFIVEALKDFAGEKNLEILDLGCGRGWLAPFLSGHGNVTGIDFSPAGIGFAERNFSDHGTFFLADASLPSLGLSETKRFDVVVCSEVIEHVPDPLALLQQIAQLLRVNGLCILTTPNGNIWPQFEQTRSRETLQPVENWIAPNRLQVLLREAGFSLLRHEGRATNERFGHFKAFQHRRVRFLFQHLKLEHLYGRLVLSNALYQVVAARKRD